MPTLVSSTAFNLETSTPSSTVDRYSYTLGTASGNDRLVVIIPAKIKNAVITATGATFDSTAGTVWQNLGIDGGNASSTSVIYFLEADLPAATGTFDIDVTWSGTDVSESPAIVLEFTGVDQTTPLENFGSATQQDQAEGGTISATLTGSSGKFAVSYLAVAELSIGTPAHTIPTGMTSAGDGKTFHNNCSAAYLTSAASGSEAYQWTYDFGTALTLDSIVTGTFAVNSTGGGTPAPTISGVTPNKATELTTATVDTYDTVSGFTYGGSALTSITEATATTVTGIMPKGGFEMGVSQNFQITDVNGASNLFGAVFNAPTGYTFVTLIAEPSWWPGLVSGDQLVYESSTTPGGYTVSIASDGTITYQVGTPDGESFDVYSLDASDSYGASSTTSVIKGPATSNDAPVFAVPGYDHLSSYSDGDAVSIDPQFSTVPSPSATYSITAGSLPTGLTLNTGTGNIAGTLNESGVQSFTVQATNTEGSDTTVVGFDVNVIPDVDYTPSAVYLVDVSVTISPVVNEAFPTPTYSIVAGSLPTGLTLNTGSGVISGSTSVLGAVAVTIRASNSEGNDDNPIAFEIIDEIEASGSGIMQFLMMDMV